MTEEEKQKILIELVKTRLLVLPPDAKLSIGSYGEFSRDEIIKQVEINSEIGKKMIEVQVEYLKMLKEGIFYADTPAY